MREGEFNFSVSSNNVANLCNKLSALDFSKKYIVTVRERKTNRSSIQNSRYWKLLTELGNFLGYTPDEMHDICKFKFLRNAIEIDGERLPLLKSTTKLTTDEMAKYQNDIELWANQMGFIFNEDM